MIRIAPLALIALASACTGSSLDTTDAVSLTADVIAGEFIIGAELSPGLADELGLAMLDYDDDLVAGLYFADDDIDVTTLEATLKQRLRGSLRVENNRIRTVSAVDTYRDLQWNLDMLDIETAWTMSTGAGVTVAVIDTGVSKIGEDTPVNLIDGRDYVDNDWNPADGNGHGTHVAGTVAQATDNGRGCAGVAPDVDLLAIRVLDDNGAGSAYWTAKAIKYAANNGADVINLSLGSAFSTATERDAVEYAADRGVVIVAASGNSGKNKVDYPAAYDDTIAVGAVQATGNVSSYSNGGNALDIVAPGGNLWQDKNRDGYGDGIMQETLTRNGRNTTYEFFEGTSMAAPHVAGAAALLIGAGASPSEVRDLLTSTADNVGASGWDKSSGYGNLDIVAALEAMGASSGNTGGGNNGGGDTLAPTISNVAGWRLGDTLSISWETSERSLSQVEFEDFGLFEDTGYRRDHEMVFTIDRGVSYYFTVIAEDEAGNVSTDGVWVSSP